MKHCSYSHHCQLFPNCIQERGIKGASALALLKDVNLSEAFPVDWMHCVLLGIVKTLLKYWLNTKYRLKKSFYIGDKVRGDLSLGMGDKTIAYTCMQAGIRTFLSRVRVNVYGRQFYQGAIVMEQLTEGAGNCPRTNYRVKLA